MFLNQIHFLNYFQIFHTLDFDMLAEVYNVEDQRVRMMFSWALLKFQNFFIHINQNIHLMIMT